MQEFRFWVTFEGAEFIAGILNDDTQRRDVVQHACVLLFQAACQHHSSLSKGFHLILPMQHHCNLLVVSFVQG